MLDDKSLIATLIIWSKLYGFRCVKFVAAGYGRSEEQNGAASGNVKELDKPHKRLGYIKQKQGDIF